MDNSREEAIKARAYELWVESGYIHGQHEAHWRQAEQELGGLNNPNSGIATVTQIGSKHVDGVGILPAQDEEAGALQPRGARKARISPSIST